MKILMVMAHPDDEVIFGWPVIQHHDHEIALLTLSHNRERHGPGASTALQVVCAENNIHYLSHPRMDNNFYRLPPRFEPVLLRHAIDHIRKTIQQAIDLVKPDCIFTHNPWGEYGHGDHRFVFSLVVGFGLPLLMTDICIPNVCHLSHEAVPGFWNKQYMATGKIVTDVHNLPRHDLIESWYDEMKGIYEKHKAWSWSGHCPVKTCRLYRFE
jgi:hypothetical protein